MSVSTAEPSGNRRISPAAARLLLGSKGASVLQRTFRLRHDRVDDVCDRCDVADEPGTLTRDHEQFVQGSGLGRRRDLGHHRVPIAPNLVTPLLPLVRERVAPYPYPGAVTG